ncbi:MAG: betaine-aldehyde dehydrogenase [Marmoricola sp.]|nr:betaine-aldehyde dehydrogenase [Marmoricola sp.]
MTELKNYIDGSWVDGEGAVLTSVNPATEQPVATFASASVAQVDLAVAAAKRSFRSGVWSRTDPKERAEALRALASLIEEREQELAEIVTAEVGTPISQSLALQVRGPIGIFRWYADMAERGPRGGYEEVLAPGGPSGRMEGFLRYEPQGVVAALTPYNFPYNMAAWKLGGALASGCSTVLLPSDKASHATATLVGLVAELGLPDGVVNLVLGGGEVGSALVSHDDVDLITFTGSDAVGRKILHAAADGIKRVVLELGGKNPNILLPGADIDSLVEATALRFASNAGQKCGSTTRIFVHSADAERFVDAVTTSLAALPVTDPMLPETVVGPLISAEHRAFVESQIQGAVERGGTLHIGGDRPDTATGYYVNPTLISGLGNDDPINTVELFAPVAAVQVYETLDEAVELANASEYGLNATVYGPFEDALEVARRIRSGSVAINTGGGQRPDAPWGGFGASGLGRELGEDGFAAFFEIKHVQWEGA